MYIIHAAYMYMYCITFAEKPRNKNKRRPVAWLLSREEKKSLMNALFMLVQFLG